MKRPAAASSALQRSLATTLPSGPGLGVAPTSTFNQHIEWFVTLRPRAGVLITPTALLYVTGGLAVAGINTDGVLSGITAASLPTSVAWSNDSTKWGWVVGAGAEARLGGNWTGKIEGLYMDYGTVSGSCRSGHQLSAAAVRLQLKDHRRRAAGRRELPFRRPGGREVLISAKAALDNQSPGIVRGFFCCADGNANLYSGVREPVKFWA